jgi:hypothetical protein
VDGLKLPYSVRIISGNGRDDHQAHRDQAERSD